MIELMPKGTNKEELSQVLEILSQIHSPENSEEDITEQRPGNRGVYIEVIEL